MTVPDKQRVTPHMARDPWHQLSADDKRQVHRLLAFGRDVRSTRLEPQGPSGIERVATTPRNFSTTGALNRTAP